MPTYNNYRGSYIDMADAVGIGEDAYKQSQQNKFKDQLSRDKHRTPFVVWDKSLADAKNIIFDPDAYEKRQSFMQGDAEGRALLGCLMAVTKNDVVEEGGEYDDFSFAYFDKDNTPCGLAIYRVKIGENALYAVTLIRNTTASPQEREVFFSCDASLLAKIAPAFDNSRSNNLKKGPNSSSVDIIKTALRSPQIEKLLTPFFTDNATAFDDLKSRMVNLNLDDRDIRQKQFQKWLQLLSPFRKKSRKVDVFAQKQETLAKSDINFYESKNFEKILSNTKFFDEDTRQKAKALLLEYKVYMDPRTPTPEKLKKMSINIRKLYQKKQHDALLDTLNQAMQSCEHPDRLAVVTKSLQEMQKDAWEKLTEGERARQIDMIGACVNFIEYPTEKSDKLFINTHRNNGYPVPEIAPKRSAAEARIDKLLTKSAQNFAIDPQGRIIYDVTDDKGHIVTVSRDIVDEKTQKAYSSGLTFWLEKAGETPDKIARILTLLNTLPNKKSIQPLQEELYLYQATLAAQQSLITDTLDAKDWAQILLNTRQKVVEMADDAFARALIYATNGITDWDTASLDIKTLNQRLDIAKPAIFLKAKQELLKQIGQNKARSGTSYHLPGPRLLYKGNNNQITAIDTTQTTDFMHQSIQTYPQQGLHIVLPSLKVDGSTPPQEIAAQVSYVINFYSIQTPLSYHLFTDRGTATDTGLKEMIVALHAVNRFAAKDLSSRVNPPYCLLQAYGSSRSERPLAYRQAFLWSGADMALNNELTLMAEMSLLYQVENSHTADCKQNYENFLNPPPATGFWWLIQFLSQIIYRKTPFFSQSPEGLATQKNIATLKKNWQTLAHTHTDNSQALIRQALQKIMAFDIHFSHRYAGLIETLTMALKEPAALTDHTKQQLANQILEQVQGLTQNPPNADIIEALQKLAAVTDKEAAKNATDKLSTLLTGFAENSYHAAARLIRPINDDKTTNTNLKRPNQAIHEAPNRPRQNTRLFTTKIPEPKEDDDDDEHQHRTQPGL